MDYIIVDFTDKLPEKTNNILFNPSVEYFKDDYYLTAYRKFIRYPELHQEGKYDDTPERNPNHPWLGGSASTTWWKSDYGSDVTKLTLLKLDKKSSNITSINLKIVDTKGKEYIDIEGVDARIKKYKNNAFIITYNSFISNENVTLAEGKCTPWCGIINMVIGILDLPKLTITLSEPVILCPEYSQRIEKNWSFWIHNDLVKFSYGLYPTHQIFNIDISNQIPKCYKLENAGISPYKQIQDYYNSFKKPNIDKFLHISVSTPAIKIYDNIYLGCGHAKYNYKILRDPSKVEIGIENTILYEFDDRQINLNKKFHPIFGYFMFLYIFDAITGNVLRITDFLLPVYSDYVLAFPCGLTTYGDDWKNGIIISFGDHDSKCKMLFVTAETIGEWLQVSDQENPKFVQNLKDYMV